MIDSDQFMAQKDEKKHKSKPIKKADKPKKK